MSLLFNMLFRLVRASLVAQMVKHLPAMREAGFYPWVGNIPWKRKWQPTPVLLPGKFHGWRSLVGYSPWGWKESDMTEQLQLHLGLVIAFLPRSKCLLISWLQSPSSVMLEPPKIKSATVSTVLPSFYHEVMGTDAMIFVFWMLSFKPTFSLSSFTFIMRLFSSSSLSAIRVVSSAYLRLLIFLPAILIPVYASSSPAFLMMYSACKLNKQGDNIQP